MEVQKDTRPGLDIPYILIFLADSILQLGGCKTEGIFRVPGDADAVTNLRLRLERNNYDLTGVTDASVPASLLKLWYVDFGIHSLQSHYELQAS
jgi:hypothetical protein